ncbi:MAG: ATP-binding protein [Candidatus Bathyarchaeota archaeon]|nr:ATP-binding protein [Candidatus Bathyarchaeota archaeon]
MREPFVVFVERELEPKTLVITCGLPASYKTGVAEEISKMTGYPILRSDLIRIDVLKGKDIFDPKVAGNMNNRMSVYDEMFRRAKTLASKGGIILDATFITAELRERAAEIAAKNNLAFAIFETNCPQEIALERIKKRSKEKYESNALTEEAYLANKKKFEPINVDALKQKYPTLKISHLIVDTCIYGIANWSIIKEETR